MARSKGRHRVQTKKKHLETKPESTENGAEETEFLDAAYTAKEDLTSLEANNKIRDEIIAEAIKIEAGKSRSIFPLVKLVKQLNELESSNKSVQ